MTNLEHLLVVETICTEGSFQKASEKLHKVRSAVSYSVKQVESFYGIQIFTRDTYRPELTAEGKVLIVQIRRLLKQANEFEAFVKEMKGEQETELKLGIGSIFPIERITDLLLDLKTTFPATTIHLDIEVASGERKLLDDDVDIAIYGSPSRHKAIDYQLIETIDVPLVVSNKMPLSRLESVSEADLSHYPQIVMKSSDLKAPDTHVVDDALKWFVTDLTTKKTLITAGLGWGRMPIHLVEKEIENQQLTCLETLGSLQLPIYVAKRKNQPLGPVAKKIWQYFSDK
ncbi:LysR family transcriptional regulator [Vibrio sp. SCSIO 43135]|uniref:LysR family transcriptional regulator n=1 Tax=Vibrio sp. SCSIO 43135 TaxID=2819096 RepID=UPI002075A549|nr:LysR family transcriptional regulator [Vibrio sp. SCSIO 43135]USD43614.1 LysR family transcriptional regulator [Vibrio sp. SCSIO 43135]